MLPAIRSKVHLVEPDYAIHIQRAENALRAVYPLMCDRKVIQAIQSAIEAQHEICRYIAWVVAHSKQ